MCRRRIKLNLSTKLMLIFIAFSMIPGFMLQSFMQRTYEERLINNASESTLSVLVANNNALDVILKRVEATSQLITGTPLYYEVFESYPNNSVSQILRNDRLVRSDLTRKFLNQEEVSDYYIYTDLWLYGHSQNTIEATVKGVTEAGWNLIAREGEGKPSWVSGYDYGERIGSEYLQKKKTYDFRYLLTMVQEMNFQYSHEGSYYVLPKDIAPPILIVHINERSIHDLYSANLPLQNTNYFLVNNENTIVSTDDKDLQIGDLAHHNFVDYIGQRGFTEYVVGGESFLLCYAPTTIGGFTSFAIVPMSTLLDATTRELQPFRILSFVLMVLIAALVARPLAGHFLGPINRLVEGSKKVAEGDFQVVLDIPQQNDLRILTQQFNHMIARIKKLIHENYETSLREKETQIMALTTQMNPHFLYNTLNTINLVAISNEDEETAELIVSLSRMLQYTYEITTEYGDLISEMQWLSNYLTIMSKRFSGLFNSHINLEAGIEHLLIPRLILQPIVENSILHGFSDQTTGGEVLICIQTFNDKRIKISVSDNGKGMTEDQVHRLLRSDEHLVNHGFTNIVTRLRLIYDQEYDLSIDSEVGKGTTVTLFLPRKQ